MGAKKYYAVKIGRTPGIYLSWADCKAQVNGYPGAIYKGFETKEEAMSREYAIKQMKRSEKIKLISSINDTLSVKAISDQ